MTQSAVRVPLVGTDLFCPDCHRWLVTFNGDGTANLAGYTTMRGSGHGPADEDGNAIGVPEDFVITEALCMMRTCRLKRWLRKMTRRT